MAADIKFEIHPVRDIPLADAKLLGHDKIISNLKTFLESSHMITPLAISIHGEWGSGKTSIMKTLAAKLDHVKFETLFFEAWKYEYSNPSLGLITEIAEKFSRENVATDIIRAGAYILSQKFLGVEPEKVLQIMRSSKAHSQTLSEKLKTIIQEKIGKRKLIIIIDDLDRCDVENSLQLLAIMKLFFDLENCICVAAVDFERLKQAWRKKYLVDKDSNENGSEYLDKMFQIQIGIPKPTPEQIADYIHMLVINLPDEVAQLFSQILPKNPRSIKRILNLVSYRINLLDSSHKTISTIFWTLLEEIISNRLTIIAHDRLINNGSSLGHLIVKIDNWKPIKDVFDRIVGNDIISKHAVKLNQFFLKSRQISSFYKITENGLNDDFKKLYFATNAALE